MNRDRDALLANVLRFQYQIEGSLRRACRNQTGLENALIPRMRRVRCQVDKGNENRGLARRYALNRVLHDDMKGHALFKIMPCQSRPGDRCTGQHSDRGNAYARRASVRAGRSGTRRGTAIRTLSDRRTSQDRQRGARNGDRAKHNRGHEVALPVDARARAIPSWTREQITAGPFASRATSEEHQGQGKEPAPRR